MDIVPNEFDRFTPIVSRFLHVDEITWGDEKMGFLVRYRGSLLNQDSAQAYDQLAQALKPHMVTPLFRIEENRHTVILKNGVINPRPTKVWGNIVFFILTLLSVTFTGAISATGSFPTSIDEWIPFMVSGLPFSIALMTILLFHEFGHYLMGRYHKVAVTLPFFIPLPYPISLFGTFGALIQLKEPPKNKRQILDIGIAGPLAGLLVDIPILIYGLSLSTLSRLPQVLPAFQIIEGNSILYLFLKFIVKGQLLPNPLTYAGMHPVFYWIRYFFTGTPAPAGAMDVMLHPIAWAGWIGLLVTSLNLIPVGSLDGGHIMYGLIGKRIKKLLPFILVILVLLCFVSVTWIFPTLLILFIGRFHDDPLDQITTLDPKRKALAILAMLIFVLIFMPVPFL